MPNSLWSEEAFLRPIFVSDEVWQKIISNFLSHVGDPLQDLPDALQDDLDRLIGMGVSAPTTFATLQFEIEQAGDFGSIAERGNTGAMGKGWSSLADVGLQISDRGIAMSGLVDPVLIATLDATRTSQYTVSVPLGKTIGQDGRFVEGGNFTRPVFTFDQRQNSGMTLEYITGGYKVTTNAGEQYLFDDAGKLESFITGTGEEITVIYDINDRISRYENAFGDYLEFTYDTNGRIASVEDGNGKIVSYTYDVNGLLTDIADDAGDSEFTYDTDGNLLTALRVGGPEITFTYDGESRLASQDIGGVSETYTYDSAGAITITNELTEELVIQIGPGGYVAGIENNLGQSVAVTADLNARTVTIEDPNGIQSELTYDIAGRLQSFTDGNDDTVSFGYDSATGRMISFTDGEGSSRAFDYDGAGRLLTATWEDDTFFEFNYDVSGNMVEFINRRGQDVEYDYDSRGRVTDVSDSASGALSYTYDVRGNLSSITSPAGVTNLAYDSAGRVTLIEYPNGRSLAYTYDSEGKRLSMVNQDNEGTFYAYDSAGRLESVSDDNSVLTSYDYDAAGRLILETNANGSYTEYEYDAAGRMNEITNYDSGTAVTSFYQYSFDLAGRKTEVVTNDGTWTYDYDDAGQLTEAIFISTTVGIPNKSVTYQYDSAGNRIETVEDSVTTNYTANDLNQYTSAGGKNFTYDDDGNLTAQTATGNNYSYVYDVDNRLIQVMKPDSTVITYEYDAFGNRSAMVDNGVRTEFLVDPFGMGNVVAEYDSVGTRIASYAYGLGLASRTDSSGNLAFFDIDATGSVVGLTDNGGSLANSYIYTPFGDEVYESETILNSFEFNGAFGVTEDSDNLLYMRARSYDVELGRFLSEDPLFLSGDVGNLYRFAGNDPVQYADPSGEYFMLLFAAGAAYPVGVTTGMLMGSKGDTAQAKAAIAGEWVKSGEAANLHGSAAAVSLAAENAWDLGNFLNDSWEKIKDANDRAKDEADKNKDADGDGKPDDPEGLNNISPKAGEKQPDGKGSPLVVDLGNDGINLHALGDYGTYFDLRGNGQSVLTGWVAPEDGLLALPGANGVVDDISELFGTQTTDGFTVLKTQDSNADGVIDASDSVFNNLRIWTDVNSDGVSQTSELHTMSELGITSINLNSTRIYEIIEGNHVTHESTFTINGNEQRIVDAWFNFNSYYTKNNEDYDFDIRTAFLPTLKGFGNIKDLYIAASVDNDELDADSLMARLIDLSEMYPVRPSWTVEG